MVGKGWILAPKQLIFTKMQSLVRKLFYGTDPWEYLKFPIPAKEPLPLLQRLLIVILFLSSAAGTV